GGRGDRPAGEEDGPRRRHRLRFQGHGGGQDRGAGKGRMPGRAQSVRNRRAHGRGAQNHLAGALRWAAVKLRALLVIVALGGAACSSGSSHRTQASVSDSSSTPASTGAVSVSSAPASSTSGSVTPPSSAPATTVSSQAPGTSTSSKPVATSQPVGSHQVVASGAFIPGDKGAAVAASPGGAVTGRIRSGVAMGVDAINGAWAHVVTPCENK